MTNPVQEQSTQRDISGLRWGERQLFRRPAPRPNAVLFIKLFSDTQTVTVGDSRFVFEISQDMDATNLTRVEAYVTTVSSSGIVQVQIRNVTEAADMLSTRVQVDASEFVSKTAGTAAVIDTANDDVAWGDLIACDVDAAGTGAKGLGVMLSFSGA